MAKITEMPEVGNYEGTRIVDLNGMKSLVRTARRQKWTQQMLDQTVRSLAFVTLRHAMDVVDQETGRKTRDLLTQIERPR